MVWLRLQTTTTQIPEVVGSSRTGTASSEPGGLNISSNSRRLDACRLPLDIHFFFLQIIHARVPTVQANVYDMHRAIMSEQARLGQCSCGKCLFIQQKLLIRENKRAWWRPTCCYIVLVYLHMGRCLASYRFQRFNCYAGKYFQDVYARVHQPLSH